MKQVKESLPGGNENLWAQGCEQCHFGIIDAPERTGACELYLERLVQAIDGDLHFCTCKAGTRYRVYLLNRFQFLKEEARRDARMADFASRGTHPDIEAARRAMAHSYGYTKAPPIRFVGNDEVVPPPADEVEEVTA